MLQPSATFERYKVSLLKRAHENGAASQIQQRLNDILTEEQRGPTADELEACRQSAIEFKRLFPGIIAQFASTLGRSVRTLLGENEADVQIEYDRKMLVPGDADGELKLAMELLQEGTTESQSEALTLLQEAAAASPAAKTQLAMFLLKGSSIAAPDPTRANELLTQAALAGDTVALLILAGPSDPAYPDRDPALPASERYAWGVFQQRLNEEGCFGSSQYVSWASFSSPTPNLLAMSPADSVAAETRAAGLLGAPMVEARKFLGCD